MSLKTDIEVVERLSVMEALSRQYIIETLSIYKPEYRYLDSAKWNGSEFIGWFRLEHYPFTKEEHIDYVTASMLMLYLSQLGFVFTRFLCERNMLPSSISITESEFFRLRDEGNIVFVGLDNIRLRRRIPISESQLEIKIRLKRKFAVKGCPVGKLSFEVAGGIFAGEVLIMIICDR